MQFKNLLMGLVLAVLVAAAMPVLADVGTIDVGITNTLKAATTTTANLGTFVNIDNVDNIGLVFKGTGDAASTDNTVLTISRSADGVTAETTPQIKWVIPANGNTQVVCHTNLPKEVVGSSGYIIVKSGAVTNATVSITNCSLLVVKKRLR